MIAAAAVAVRVAVDRVAPAHPPAPAVAAQTTTTTNAPPSSPVAPDPATVTTPSSAPAATNSSIPSDASTMPIAGNPLAAQGPPTITAGAMSALQQMPTGDYAGWNQVFADDFEANVPLGQFPAAVSPKWWDYPEGWRDTSKNGTYSPSRAVSVHDGMMDIYLHSESGSPLVAAPVPILRGKSAGQGQLYGMYVMRFRADPVPGYKTAWLLWPDSESWPTDGEIDFPEGDLTSGMCGFMHYQGATTANDQASACTPQGYTSWHTAVILWSPTKVQFALDGVTLSTVTTRIPDTPMHFVLQTETTTDGTVPASTAAGHVYLDWVAVYSAA